MVARNQSTVCLVWEKGGVPSKLWGPELAMCGPSPVIEVRERDIVGRVSPRVRVFEVNDPFRILRYNHLGNGGWNPRQKSQQSSWVSVLWVVSKHAQGVGCGRM